MKQLLRASAFLLMAAAWPACSQNNYKVHYKVLYQNQNPAEGFRVDVWVKGKSEPKTIKTDAHGMADFAGLPKPDSVHPLRSVLHYFRGPVDDARDITYPYIASDAKRLNDTQYIPNTATPEAPKAG